MSQLLSVTPGPLYRHKLTSSLLLFNLSLLAPPNSLLGGRAFLQRVALIAWCVSHILRRLHYIKVQATHLFGWLMFNLRSIMNLQALITTPLPSQFLAILYLWLLLCLCMCNCLVLIWKDFTSLAGFYTILLICPDCYLSQFVVCVFYSVFFANLTSYTFFFLLFLGCIVLLSLARALEVFVHCALGFSSQVMLLTQSFLCAAWCHWPCPKALRPALQPWTYHGQLYYQIYFFFHPTSVCAIRRCIDGGFFFF